MPYNYYYMDWSYIVLIVFGLLAMAAQLNVKGTFSKYSKLNSGTGYTGAQAARLMLDRAGLYSVQVLQVAGSLSDHYNPSNQTVNLSGEVYNGTSVAAIAVACHECGHAIQHGEGYAPLNLRSMFFPVASIGSQAGVPLFIAGLIFNLGFLTTFGIIFFSASVLFQVVTLPVEFNASARALERMTEYGLVTEGNMHGAKKVLSAAALTYVAAAAVAIANLIRLILISRRRN